MTTEELRLFIAARNNPELAKPPGMVYQIWEDGEITLQKSGYLLWQRSLHSIQYPPKGPYKQFTKEIMPIQEEKHGYAFITKDNIEPIYKAMSETVV